VKRLVFGIKGYNWFELLMVELSVVLPLVHAGYVLYESIGAGFITSDMTSLWKCPGFS